MAGPGPKCGKRVQLICQTCSRYVYDFFQDDYFRENHVTTIGVDFVSKQIMSLCLIVYGRKTHTKRTIANYKEIISVSSTEWKEIINSDHLYLQ